MLLLQARSQLARPGAFSGLLPPRSTPGLGADCLTGSETQRLCVLGGLDKAGGCESQEYRERNSTDETNSGFSVPVCFVPSPRSHTCLVDDNTRLIVVIKVDNSGLSDYIRACLYNAYRMANLLKLTLPDATPPTVKIHLFSKLP